MATLPLQSYTDLLAELATWLNRTDLTAELPTFVYLAEQRLRRQQEWYMEVYSLGPGAGNPLTITANPVTLPNYVRELKNLWVAQSDHMQPIEIVTPAQWRDLVQTNRNTGGQPTVGVVTSQMSTWMAAAGGTGPTLTLWPTPIVNPGDTFAIDFEYVRDLQPSIITAGSNALFLMHPDTYLYGALLQSAPFLQHDERIATWQAMYDQAIAEINTERERVKYGSSNKRTRLPRSFG